MNPRRLDPESLQSKLELMVPLLEFLGPRQHSSADDPADDLQLRLSLERTLTVLVDLAVSINSHVVRAAGLLIPNDYQSTFGAAAKAGVITRDLADRIAPSAATRNVLTHRYGDIDLVKVAAALPLAYDGHREFIRQVSQWLLDRADTR